MPDADLEIRGGGRSSRPLDKRGEGRGRGASSKIYFRFGLKIIAGAGPLGTSPGSTTGTLPHHNGGDLLCFYIKRYDFMRKLNLRRVTPV